MEKKNVLIVWDDYYHPEANYREAVRKSFEEQEPWQVTKTHRIRDILSMDPKPDLCIYFTVGCPQGEEQLSLSEQEQVKELVESGMGMMFIHAGMACIQDDTPFFELARGRFASHPEPHYDVCCTKIPGCTHPVMEGIEPFVSPDEHYFCHVDVDCVIPLMTGASEAGTELAAWAHTVGKGRIVSMTPGHNHPMLIKMRPLMENAAKWCTGLLA